MANKEIRDYPDFAGESNEGYLIVGGKTSSISGGKILLSDIGGGGGSGGLSPVVPTSLTPTIEDNLYKVTIPNNNAYYNITFSESHPIRITLPELGVNEYYNIIIFLFFTDSNDKDVALVDSEGSTYQNLYPMDDVSNNGNIYGSGMAQMTILGLGYKLAGKCTENW